MTTTSPSIQSPVFSPVRIGGLTLRNPIVRAGCFEGLCQGGQVTDRLIEHHRRVAAGGVGMTTVAYCSVSYDGRAFGHEMWMREEILPGLRHLADAVHAEGAAVSIQLGHCGFFADPKVIGHRTMGASRQFCAYRMSICKAMTQAEIEEKTMEFARAAAMAKSAGFDAVEIHAGHGYLLSQFLSPYTNYRKDAYGGSLENRLRFPVDVIRRVRNAVGPDFPVLVKMNQSDGFTGGLELDEAVQVARAFEAAGASGLIPSCGFTARTPLFMMRGNVPTLDMARGQEDLLQKVGLILFGNLLVQRYPFAPLFLLEGARKIKDAVHIPVGYVGGVLSLEGMEQATAEGFAFVEVGRATVRDPDFPRRLESGEITQSDCDHCNRCIATMSIDGVTCVSRVKGLWHE
jgi:2,4-dienoyl-CoA reductase-like NADH-dependent reductase (Old Yellow Enzyme family)